jgi:diguanylate cyclase (GGDEF)-like protein
MRIQGDQTRTSAISRLPARLVVVTCLILVAAVILLAWSRESGNSDARQAEAARIQAAVESELHRLALEAVDFAGKAGAPGAELHNNRPSAVELAIIELGQPPQAGDASTAKAVRVLSDPLSDVARFLSQTLRGPVREPGDNRSPTLRLYPRDTLSGFADMDGTLTAWVLVPAHRDGENGGRATFAILAQEAADSSFAARVAVASRSGFVTLQTRPHEKGHYQSITFRNNGYPVYISWKPDRPGDRLSTQLGALFISIMAVYTGFVAFYMTRRLAESEVEKARLATQDSLTGTANRLLMTILIEDAIMRARRSNKCFALIYVDFDRFKEINDTFGHDAGDQLIIMASQRIEETLGPEDRLARFGGDEFSIIKHEVLSVRDCENLAERLLSQFHKPFRIGKQDLFIGASIGIAVSKDGAEDREELMRRADLALYRAKNEGRGRFIFYDDAMNSELQRQKQLEDELRQAIRNNEFEVHYQPIVTNGTHQLACVEALVRWNHRDRGIVTPSEFIALAEERGLIVELGEWVLRQACTDALHWPGIRLAVNISAAQFRHKDFVRSVQKVVEETGFDPHRLELEMTESVVIDKPEEAAQAIEALRASGIRIALDDFGTGYSSLIYLRRFAIDKIKIDRSFVELMETSNESREIVRNVIDLGRRLDLTVTAEGVENNIQIAMLEEFGCSELQGYYFGRPVPQLAVAPMVAADRVVATSSAEGKVKAA